MLKELKLAYAHVAVLSETDRTYTVVSAAAEGALADNHQFESVEGSSIAAVLKTSRSVGSVAYPRNEWFKDWAKANSSRSPCGAFLTVPIQSPSRVVGAITVGHTDPQRFAGSWWADQLSILATGLLQGIATTNAALSCTILEDICRVNTVGAMATIIVNGLPEILSGFNIKFGARFALVTPDLERALVFEDVMLRSAPPPTPSAPRAPKPARRPSNSSRRRSTGPSGTDGLQRSRTRRFSAMEARIMGTFISTSNTVLKDAITLGKARFVPDCGIYIQRAAVPHRDIFISSSEAGGSIRSMLVAPLTWGDTVIGAMYLTSWEEMEAEKVKDDVSAFLRGLLPVLCEKLTGGLKDKLAHLFQEGCEVPGGATYKDQATRPDGGFISMVNRFPTQALVHSLQEEIRRIENEGEGQDGVQVQELEVSRRIGEGGFGVVYLGVWTGLQAAVKVVKNRGKEREVMKDAFEVAVLTTLSHPNIVQVHTHFTDVLQSTTTQTRKDGKGKTVLTFRSLGPMEQADPKTHLATVLVMEYCDRGSLKEAIRNNLFMVRDEAGSLLGRKMLDMLRCLVETASAVKYLHTKMLLHCDLKPGNVLLKSSATDSRGFTTKLTDFGLSKMLVEDAFILNQTGSGTVTHIAPELMLPGSRITQKVDVYAFGIVMWEMYCGRPPYEGMLRKQIMVGVCYNGLRPEFPTGVPPAYQALVAQCWDRDPDRRPTFDKILDDLCDIKAMYQTAEQHVQV